MQVAKSTLRSFSVNLTIPSLLGQHMTSVSASILIRIPPCARISQPQGVQEKESQGSVNSSALNSLGIESY